MYNNNSIQPYQNYGPYVYPANSNPHNEMQGTDQDDRFFVGGFAAPFLLGGLTGALVAPAFNRPNYYYPVYPPYPYYPNYYSPYGRY